MEENKENMVQKIKQWLAIETKINQLSREIRELRAMKKSINPELLTIMKENEIDCFDCNSGKITYTKNNVKKTINKKYLHIYCKSIMVTSNPLKRRMYVISY